MNFDVEILDAEYSLISKSNLFAASNFIVSLLLVLISWIIALMMFSRIKKSQRKKNREYEKKNLIY